MPFPTGESLGGAAPPTPPAAETSPHPRRLVGSITKCHIGKATGEVHERKRRRSLPLPPRRRGPRHASAFRFHRFVCELLGIDADALAAVVRRNQASTWRRMPMTSPRGL